MTNSIIKQDVGKILRDICERKGIVKSSLRILDNVIYHQNVI